DTQRYPHPPHLNTGGPKAHVSHLSDRVPQSGDLLQSLDHGIDTGWSKLQTVQQRVIQPACAACFHVLLIGGQDGGATLVDAVSHRQQSRVLLRSARTRHGAAGHPSLAAEGLHVGIDVKGSSTVHVKTRVMSLKRGDVVKKEGII